MEISIHYIKWSFHSWAPTGAAGVEGAPQARTDITVLRSNSAALVTTVTCQRGSWGPKNLQKPMENIENPWKTHGKPMENQENIRKPDLKPNEAVRCISMSPTNAAAPPKRGLHQIGAICH